MHCQIHNRFAKELTDASLDVLHNLEDFLRLPHYPYAAIMDQIEWYPLLA